MTIDKLIHLHFLSLYVFVLIIFLVVLYIKLKNKKAPKLLSKEKFYSTLTEKMIESSSIEKNMFNIWPFVNELKKAKIISKKINEKDLVYKVYRNFEENFEHILLTTEKDKHFVVVIVNLNKNKIKGYYTIELKNEYSK
jgi:hypothetical protein